MVFKTNSKYEISNIRNISEHQPNHRIFILVYMNITGGLLAVFLSS